MINLNLPNIKLTKTHIYIIVVVVVIISFYLIYRYGVNKGTSDAGVGNVNVLPSQTNWGADLTPEESYQVQLLSKSLYDSMKGLNIWSRDMTPFLNYLSTSDRVFVGVANHFYYNYGKGDNLAKWISDENFGWTNPGEGNDIKSQLLERLQKFSIIP